MKDLENKSLEELLKMVEGDKSLRKITDRDWEFFYTVYTATQMYSDPKKAVIEAILWQKGEGR